MPDAVLADERVRCYNSPSMSKCSDNSSPEENVNQKKARIVMYEAGLARVREMHPVVIRVNKKAAETEKPANANEITVSFQRRPERIEHF